MSGLWFRVYDEALDDPRLQRLPASLLRTWFNVLCATSRNGGTLPDLSELAFMLRTRPGALSRRLDALKAAGLILEETDGALRPVEWEKRQFVERAADPTAAERMRRFRERAAERNGAVTPTARMPIVETVWVSATSPEWRAWADHWRATKGKSPPVDARGGWRFPSRCPPAPLEQAA